MGHTVIRKIPEIQQKQNKIINYRSREDPNPPPPPPPLNFSFLLTIYHVINTIPSLPILTPRRTVDFTSLQVERYVLGVPTIRVLII